MRQHIGSGTGSIPVNNKVVVDVSHIAEGYHRRLTGTDAVNNRIVIDHRYSATADRVGVSSRIGPVEVVGEDNVLCKVCLAALVAINHRCIGKKRCLDTRIIFTVYVCSNSGTVYARCGRGLGRFRTSTSTAVEPYIAHCQVAVAFNLKQRIVVGARHRREFIVAARIADNLDDTIVIAHHRRRQLAVVNRYCLHNIDDIALLINPHCLGEALQIVVRVVLDFISCFNFNVRIVGRSVGIRLPIPSVGTLHIAITVCVHHQLLRTRWRHCRAGQRLARSHIDGVALQSSTYLNINIELIVGRRFRLGVVVFTSETHPRQRRLKLGMIVVEAVEFEAHVNRCRRTTVEGTDPNTFASLAHLRMVVLRMVNLADICYIFKITTCRLRFLIVSFCHLININTFTFVDMIPSKGIVDILRCTFGRFENHREMVVVIRCCAVIGFQIEPVHLFRISIHRIIFRSTTPLRSNRVMRDGILQPFHTGNIYVALLERGGDSNLAHILVCCTFVEHCQHRSLEVVEVLDDRRDGDSNLDRTHKVTVLVELVHREYNITRNGGTDILVIGKRKLHRRDGTHGTRHDGIRDIATLIGDVLVTRND